MTDRERTIEELVGDEYFHKLIINPDQDCIEFWKQWENENTERSGYISSAKEILLSIHFKTHSISDSKREFLWKSISAQIDKTSILEKQRRRTKFRKLYYSIAASIAFILVSALIYNFLIVRIEESIPQEVKLIEIEAPKGKISSYRFEDGSIVKLFSGTKIIFPEYFSELKREVYIEGEAYFDVSKDVNRPFIVKTSSLITTALGTSFNVRTYENTNKCDISLVTGKVKVEKVDKSLETLNEIMLEPGEEARLMQSGVVKQTFDVKERTGWKDGYIYLNNKSFEESITILKRWYHVDFIAENQQKSKGERATGKFKNQRLDNILDVMGHTFDFSFRMDEDKIYITFK